MSNKSKKDNVRSTKDMHIAEDGEEEIDEDKDVQLFREPDLASTEVFLANNPGNFRR